MFPKGPAGKTADKGDPGPKRLKGEMGYQGLQRVNDEVS